MAPSEGEQMIVKPRIRGFICTTAHPRGCAAHVDQQINYVTEHGTASGVLFKTYWCWAARVVMDSPVESSRALAGGRKRSVCPLKSAHRKQTASAGWYNNKAFESRAALQGLYAKTLDGDAFSNAMREQALATIKADLGKIDLVL